MMNALCILIFVCLALLSVPVTVLLVQVLAATFLINKSEHPQLERLSGTVPTILVLMPAHNEALVIGHTIESILPQLKTQDTLLVVADNCTDETATIASSLGAKVLLRENKLLRGKSYALDFGIQSLKESPPEVIIIVDADCTVSEGSLQMLANYCVDQQRSVQSLYLMELPSNPSIKARIAHLAWIVKNKVRPLGFKRLGFPCQLMGTGMAFLWDDISRVNLASGHIAEDMKLGVDLAILHKAPIFMPGAVVSSVFPESKEAIASQRTRWEHGHLSVMLTEAPRLLIEAIRNANYQALGLLLDLIVPPLALLILMTTGMLLLSVIVNLWVSVSYLTIWACFLLCVLTFSVVAAWYRFGRKLISFQQLCYAPVYAVGKVGLYLKFMVNRQVEWVRSKRD